MRIRNFIQLRATAIYFGLAFLLAWGSVFFVLGWDGLQGNAPDSSDFVPVMVAMFAGPAIAGILMTAIVAGAAGLRDLWTRWGRWCVNWRWYAIAISIAPVLFGGILISLSLISPTFMPGLLTASDKTTLLVLGIATTFIVGLFEEIGWTGFATPMLLRRHSVLATGLIIGVPWGAWHLLPDWWGSASAFGSLFAVHFMVWWPQFIAFRVLMTWVYRHTQSLWVGQLMHASFTGSQVILGPMTASILSTAVASPTDSLLWNGLFAIALWVLMAVVVAAEGKQLSSRPLQLWLA